jgi:hypothetical protein
MIPNLDHLVSWVDQLSLDRDIFEWVVVEIVGVFSSDLVGGIDRSRWWIGLGVARIYPPHPVGHPSEEGIFMRVETCNHLRILLRYCCENAPNLQKLRSLDGKRAKHPCVDRGI